MSLATCWSSPSGFSTSTGRPRSSSGTASSAWLLVDVATTTASHRSIASHPSAAGYANRPERHRHKLFGPRLRVVDNRHELCPRMGDDCARVASAHRACAHDPDPHMIRQIASHRATENCRLRVPAPTVGRMVTRPRGLKPMIRISPVHVDERAVEAVVSVLRSGQLAQGDEIASFEREFATLCGTRHAIAVSSGTTALTAALIAAGVGAGDEVITDGVLVRSRCQRVARDRRDRALRRRVDRRLRDRSRFDWRTRDGTHQGDRPVHLFGQSADMTEILRVAGEHDLRVIEDAAQSHGAEYEGRRRRRIGTRRMLLVLCDEEHHDR